MNITVKGAPNSFHLSYGFFHFGEGFRTVLFTWYVAIHLGMSSEQVGFLQTLSRSPFLLFLVFGGIISDKLGVFRTFTVVSSIYALTLIGVGITTHFWGGSYAVVIGLSIVSGFASAICSPAIDTFIPHSTQNSAETNSVDASLIYNAAKLLGTFSNIFVSFAGAAAGFILNSVPYFLGVVFLANHVRLRGIKDEINIGEREHRKFGSLKSATVHLMSNPKCRDIVFSSALNGLFSAPIGFIILPFIIRENFHGYIDVLVLPYITYWFGAILASSAAKRYLQRITWLGNVSLVLWLCAGVSIMALPFVKTFVLLCVVLFLVGFFVSAAKPLLYGYYLKHAPVSEKALLVSIDQMAFWIMATINITLMGQFMGAWGVNNAVIGNSVIFIALVGVLALRNNIGSITNEDVYVKA
ncbi:MFS transporter [Rhizobium rhizogenes]|uniref:Transmembrane secretion effector family protein n=1 Tax=Rhizobium rhizogenes TaxID=359 RepID=A0A7S5DSZ7_RHIRH|nr:MFS transporter [Rhizobium rhizogenes]QCL10402.1 transmembrane secretion effector family protein [Rhizobium rhizogenes]QCO89368.1 transmembrane secretion effector family protein [Rhizobium rhizogenes]